MRFIFLKLSVLLIFTQISCGQKNIKIDPYLMDNHKVFDIKNHDSGSDTMRMGHFDIYTDEFNTAWMKFARIDKYFNGGEIHTFSSSNNDNYIYNNLLLEMNDPAALSEYAKAYNMEIDIPENFKRAFIAYFYAPHDEYAKIFIEKNEGDIAGFASNKYEHYEIIPVYSYEGSDKIEKKLPGYQVRLNRQMVGAYQRSGKPRYYMTSEYCDATEIIIATIVGTINRINKL